MNTLNCKNKSHVIKEAYSQKDTDLPFERVADALSVLPAHVSISAALFWLFGRSLEWCVKIAEISALNDIPSNICSSCRKSCDMD